MENIVLDTWFIMLALHQPWNIPLNLLKLCYQACCYWYGVNILMVTNKATSGQNWFITIPLQVEHLVLCTNLLHLLVLSAWSVSLTFNSWYPFVLFDKCSSSFMFMWYYQKLENWNVISICQLKWHKAYSCKWHSGVWYSTDVPDTLPPGEKQSAELPEARWAITSTTSQPKQYSKFSCLCWLPQRLHIHIHVYRQI